MSFQQEESRVPTRLGRVRITFDDNSDTPGKNSVGEPLPRYKRTVEVEVLDQFGQRMGTIKRVDFDAIVTPQRRTAQQTLQDEIRTKANENLIKPPVVAP